MNSKNIIQANKDALERVKTIDELSNQIQLLNNSIFVRTEKIKEMGTIILKNLHPEKIRTGLKMKNRWNSEDEIIFTNYGFGIQQSYGTNATSFKEMSADNFVNLMGFVLSNLDRIKPLLKEKNYETLKNFVKNSNLLIRNDKKKTIDVNLNIEYTNTYLLKDIIKTYFINKLSYYEHQIIFDIKVDDDYGGKDNIKIDLKNPQLDDALVIEQIFDETKQLLEKEIEELKSEEQNYKAFTDELKKDFQAKMMFAELQKSK